jgi:hypothetical protein
MVVVVIFDGHLSCVSVCVGGRRHLLKKGDEHTHHVPVGIRRTSTDEYRRTSLKNLITIRFLSFFVSLRKYLERLFRLWSCQQTLCGITFVELQTVLQSRSWTMPPVLA